MIRIAHIADSHFDDSRRLDDTVRVHREFVEAARGAGVSLIVHSGDLYERRSTPAERNAAAEFLIDAADVAQVVLIRGNHDAIGDLDILARLERPSEDSLGITVHDRPSAVGAGRIAVLALPWFDKSNLATMLPPERAQHDTTGDAVAIATTLLAGLRAQAAAAADAGRIPILVAHPLVAGSEVSTGQTLIGQTVELSPHDLRDVGCAYAALGHIHKPQDWYDGRVSYAGSPEAHNFGEDHAHGWKLVTIDPGRWREPGGVTVEFRALAGRGIVLHECDGVPDPIGLELEGGRTVDGALVRVRYRVRAEDAHAIDHDAIREAYIVAGAHDVKLEAVIVHETRARVPEIVEARDVWSKITAFWKAKGIEVSDEQQERVREKLVEVEVAS